MWQVTQLEEHRRAMSIRLYGLDRTWDDVPQAELDEIVTLVRDTLGTDGAGINLLVDEKQVTVAGSGHGAPPIPRDLGVCSVVMGLHLGDDVVEIPDLRELDAFAHNPFVDGSMAALRFYAAAPLVGKHGLALGTLCAWSLQPASLDERQRTVLRQLGRAVVNLLDERRRALTPDDEGVLRPAR